MTTCQMVFKLPEHDLIFPTVLQLQGLLHLLQDPHSPKIKSSFSSCRGQGRDGEDKWAWEQEAGGLPIARHMEKPW